MPERILAARKANTTPSDFIQPGPRTGSEERALLLFVHGIFGGTFDTWCHPNDTCLYNLILASPEFADRYDAFAFGFPSSVVKEGSFNIPEAAKSLYSEIKFRQFSKHYEQMVIVAHSMGGLVALELLASYEDVSEQVPLVITYSTPYMGSQVAALGEKLLDNPALRDMVPVDDDNSLLTSLGNRWKLRRGSLTNSARVVCAYETIAVTPLFSSLIVPQSSATALCDEPADPIAEDHIGVVKPDNDTHTAFKVLVNALRGIEEQETGSVAQGLTPADLAGWWQYKHNGTLQADPVLFYVDDNGSLAMESGTRVRNRENSYSNLTIANGRMTFNRKLRLGTGRADLEILNDGHLIGTYRDSRGVVTYEAKRDFGTGMVHGRSWCPEPIPLDECEQE